MSQTLTAQYFDFLDDYSHSLEKSIRLPNLDLTIKNLRTKDYSQARYICNECRRILELMVNSIYYQESQEKNDLHSKIEFLKMKKLLPKSYASKAHKIRMIGNESTHGYKSIDYIHAADALKYLDELMRFYIYKNFDNSYLYTVKIEESDPFIHQIKAESEELVEKMHSLPGTENNEIRSDLKETQEQVTQYQLQLNNLLKAASSVTQTEDYDIEQPINEETNHIFEVVEQSFDSLELQKQRASSRLKTISGRIDRILDEASWINEVLEGKGSVTPKQLQILKHEGDNLQIRGGAGSGKTVCLLAKAIDTASSKDTDTDKKALIISFNRMLSSYLKTTLSNVNINHSNYEISTFDSFAKNLAEKHHLVSGRIIYSYKNLKFNNPYGKQDLIREAVDTVRLNSYLSGDKRFLTKSKEIVNFLEEEFDWMESKEGQLTLENYQTIARIGRGRQYVLNRNSAEREQIYLVFEEYLKLLSKYNVFTINQAIKAVLESDIKPLYDVIAIDEAQDLSVISIKMLNKLLKPDGKIIVVGDENQKLYRRDFTWKEVGINFRGSNTISLQHNLRNTEEIARFSGRLLEDNSENQTNYAKRDPESVKIESRNLDSIINQIEELARTNQLICVVVFNHQEMRTVANALQSRRIAFTKLPQRDSIKSRGIYLSNIFQTKGLEFDRIIMPFMNYSESYDNDPIHYNNLLYVAFSRARNNLDIYYQDKPHQVLLNHYSDYLLNQRKTT